MFDWFIILFFLILGFGMGFFPAPLDEDEENRIG